MQLCPTILSVYMHIEIGLHVSLNWRALFMQPDFLSAKEYVVARLWVESSPAPSVVVGP